MKGFLPMHIVQELPSSQGAKAVVEHPTASYITLYGFVRGKNISFPRLYRCLVPRQEYLELIEAPNAVFADLYFGFNSFHSLYVSVNAAGQIVIHGEGTANDKARLEQAACVDFIWDNGEKSLFIAHLNRMTHLTTGQRLQSRKERLRVLSVRWGEQGLEYSFYVHDEASMEWNFVQQSQPYMVSMNTTTPVDVNEDHQSDSRDQFAPIGLRLRVL